jgi:1-deoxy-D-xylulose-5-phosphate reductoisomerase
VIARHPTKYKVIALTAYRNDERLFEQCVAFQPEVVVLVERQAAQRLRLRLAQQGLSIDVLDGEASLVEAALLADTVMAAIVGAAGLKPTFAAALAGKKILLANKEALVMSGPLLMDCVTQRGCQLLPIDSEHNAIFQCLPHDSIGRRSTGVAKLWLTASGGPFLRTPLAECAKVTPAQAVRHPKWQMGAKISVDSATLMNKGLERIEAVLLFDMPVSDVKVVIHPQSIVHSLVEYEDGSTLAQLGQADMRIPIAHALAWPSRMASGVSGLNMFELPALEFEAPDHTRFASLRLCEHAALMGQSAPTVLNAANEVAVAAFLAGQLNFLGITEVIERVLSQCPIEPVGDLETVLAIDQKARRLALSMIG